MHFQRSSNCLLLPESQAVGDGVPEVVPGARGDLFEKGLGLCEGHLDGVEAGAAGRQEAEFGAGVLDGFADGGGLVRGHRRPAVKVPVLFLTIATIRAFHCGFSGNPQRPSCPPSATRPSAPAARRRAAPAAASPRAPAASPGMMTNDDKMSAFEMGGPVESTAWRGTGADTRRWKWFSIGDRGTGGTAHDERAKTQDQEVRRRARHHLR